MILLMILFIRKNPNAGSWDLIMLINFEIMILLKNCLKQNTAMTHKKSFSLTYPTVIPVPIHTGF